jgi:hypothetical protein
MGYLQLAENPYNHLAAAPAKDLYIFVPAGFRGAIKDMWIREDSLDNLSDTDFNELMTALAPYQDQGMSYGFTQLSGKEERRARRDARKARKKEKQDVRSAKRQARMERAKSGQTALDKIIGGAQNIVGTVFGTTAAADSTRAADISGNIGGVEFSLAPEEESFFQKYRTPILIGGAGLAGFLLYNMLKK